VGYHAQPPVDDSYPRPISNWDGIPNGVGKLTQPTFNPNSNGLGRICPRPVWGLNNLKKLKCEKFKKISIPPLGSSGWHASSIIFRKGSFTIVFLSPGKVPKKRGCICPKPFVLRGKQVTPP